MRPVLVVIAKSKGLTGFPMMNHCDMKSLYRNLASALIGLLIICSHSGCDSGAGTDEKPPPIPDTKVVDREPTWSPDGNCVAFVHTPLDTIDVERGLNQIWLFSLATGDRHYLTEGRTPDWNPASNEIAYVLERDVWAYDVVSNVSRQITYLGNVSYPKWSPDGTTLLFRNWTEENLNTLWLCLSDGSNVRDIGIHCGAGADWRPDGRHIVTTTYSFDPLPQLALLDTTELSLEQITDPPLFVQYPSVSPFGEWVAFLHSKTTSSAPASGLWVLDFSNSSLLNISDYGDQTSWSPNGSFLAYTNINLEGISEIWIYEISTGMKSRLDSFSGDPHKFEKN